MFYDEEVSIIGDTGEMNDYGRWVEGENTVIEVIECDIQPYNKELAYRDYAFNEDVKYRMFCDPNPLIKNGIQVSYREQFKDEDTIFNVVNIVPWNDFWVVLLDD